jgi:tetratricopeptide (TPR) repeat protein
MKEAEPLYRRAIEIDEKVFGKDQPEVATDYNNLASLLETQGKYNQAEPLYRRAIEIGEKVLGKDHPDVAIRYNNLALIVHQQ